MEWRVPDLGSWFSAVPFIHKEEAHDTCDCRVGEAVERDFIYITALMLRIRT